MTMTDDEMKQLVAMGFTPDEVEATVAYDKLAADIEIDERLAGEEVMPCEEAVAETPREKVKLRKSREWRLKNPRFKEIATHVLKLCGYKPVRSNFRKLDAMITDWFKFNRALKDPQCSAICNTINQHGDIVLVKAGGRAVEELLDVPVRYRHCPNTYLNWAHSGSKVFSHWWGEGPDWNRRLSDREYIDKYGADQYSERLNIEQVMDLVYGRGMTADEAIAHVECGEWDKEQEMK